MRSSSEMIVRLLNLFADVSWYQGLFVAMEQDYVVDVVDGRNAQCSGEREFL